MYSYLFNKELKEGNIFPCYFFWGEETYLGDQFIRHLNESLISPDNQEYTIEKLRLSENSWPEIIDIICMIPVFFSPWRIIAIEIPENRKESLSSNDKKLLSNYFSSPLSRTTIVIIYQGKLKKKDSLLKFFTSVDPSVVCTKELKALNDRSLFIWMDRKLSVEDKVLSPEAKKRLAEVKGNDLRGLDNELEKLVAYVDKRKVIELDDVNQLSGWTKTSFEWELSNSLEKGDFEQSLLVLNTLFKEGVRQEYIIGIIARFFRDIMLAKIWLKDRSRDRKSIYGELRPHITEKFGTFYRTKFTEFFSLVERISLRELNDILVELRRIDLLVKTTGVNCRTYIERFLFGFCFSGKRGKVTWRER